MPDTDTGTPLEVTSAAGWNKSRTEGFIQRLPSGNVARLRKTLSLMNLIKTGQIPNPLGKHLRNVMQSGGKVDLDLKSMDEESLKQVLEMVDSQIPDIFIEPRVYAVPEGENPYIWTPDDHEAVSVAALDFEDRFFAFSFAQGGVTDLDSFRVKSAEAVATLEDVEQVQDEAVEPTGGE